MQTQLEAIKESAIELIKDGFKAEGEVFLHITQVLEAAWINKALLRVLEARGTIKEIPCISKE